MPSASVPTTIPSPRPPASARSPTPTNMASTSTSASTSNSIFPSSPTRGPSFVRTSSFSQSHGRRPSIPLSPVLSSTSPRAVPLPVPQRHPGGPLSSGSYTQSIGHRGSFGKTASASDVWFGASEGGSGGAVRPPGHARTGSSASMQQRSSQTQFQTPGQSLSGSLTRVGSLGRESGWSDADMQRRAAQRESATAANRGPALALGGLGEVRDSWAAEDDRWLNISAREILEGHEGEVQCVKGSLGMEIATDILLKSGHASLLVEMPQGGHAFFDYADLNTFLLLVLQAASKEPVPDAESALDEDTDALSSDQCAFVMTRLRAGRSLSVGDICNISQKNEYHSFSSHTTLRTLLPLFASGLHRVTISSDSSDRPLVLNENMLLEYLISLPDETRPNILSLPVSSPALLLGLNPLVSLPGAASVLDAMQVMAIQGFTALGVLNGSSLSRSRSLSHSSSAGSGSSGGGSGSHITGSILLPRNSSASALSASPGLLPSPATLNDPLPAAEGAELLSIVTAQECAALVVPSEGKKILGMSLLQMTRDMQQLEPAGMEKGEERFPVHTVSASATLLHASHLILATASSRVFLRSSLISPPLSPTPSLSMSASSPFSSPALSQLSLSDPIGTGSAFGTPYGPRALASTASRPHPGLPPAPPTRLSSHSVISILDILSCLAKAYASRLTPPTPNEQLGALALGIKGDEWSHPLQPGVMTPEEEEGLVWDLNPKGLSRRRTRTGSISQTMRAGGFERWRWAAEDKA